MIYCINPLTLLLSNVFQLITQLYTFLLVGRWLVTHATTQLESRKMISDTFLSNCLSAIRHLSQFHNIQLLCLSPIQGEFYYVQVTILCYILNFQHLQSYFIIPSFNIQPRQGNPYSEMCRKNYLSWNCLQFINRMKVSGIGQGSDYTQFALGQIRV